jgi:hypothetical protein
VILTAGRSALLGLALVPYACLSLFSCSPTDQQIASAASAEALRVLVGGDLHGYIAPCGCTKPMLGGMTRRGTLVHNLEEASALVKVENGNFAEASGRQGQLKAETLVEMLADMRYDAINAGDQEFMLGLPYVKALQEQSGGRLICANVCDAAGQPVLTPYTIVTKTVGKDKVKVAILGVLSSQHADTIAGLNPGIEVRPPESVIQASLPSLSGADIRILLVQGSHDEAEELSKQFPDFQIVAYAREDDASTDTHGKTGVTLVCPGKKGRALGIVSMAKGSAWTVSGLEYRKVGPELADNAKTVEIEKTYLERVASENLLASYPRSAMKPGEGFAGSTSCKTCHPAAAAVWEKSAHARAYQTLVSGRHDRDPECVSCHVVGLDRVGGFTDHAKTPTLENVGCESCHGPSAQHVANPKKFAPSPAGESSCKSCHVPDHSPGFDFNVYWQKIKH